jgi:hypothetical protein
MDNNEDNQQQESLNTPSGMPPQPAEATQQPTNTTVVPDKKRGRLKLVLWIAAFFLLIIVGIASIVSGLNTEDESNKDSNELVTQTSDETAENSSIEKFDEKNYKFTDNLANYSIIYPNNWSLEYDEDFVNIEGQEGAISTDTTLVSDSGLKMIISFNNYGGKGGACEPDENDVPHASGNVCPTGETIFTEKTESTYKYLEGESYKNASLYLIREKFTDSGDAKTVYYSGLTSSDTELFPTEPSMGYYFASSGFSFIPGPDKDIYFHYDIFIEPKGESEEYFKQKDVIEAEEILKSFRVEE